MNEEGKTSANHSQASAAAESVTAAIVRHWWLLAAVAAAQVAIAGALRVVPLSALRARTTGRRRLAQFFVRESSEHVAWAIEATGRRLGRVSSCLARAVVAEILLDADDGPVRFSIGVRHTAAGAFEAHAWVTRADRVLIGAPTDGFVPIVTWTSPSE